LECFVADGGPLAAFEAVAVVVEHLFERAAVDDRLVALKARALLAFVRLKGDRAELDALDRPPRLGVARGSATTGAAPRATPSISSVMSTPMTRPVGPTTWAAMKQIFPVPLPRSSTVSPGCTCCDGSPQP